MVKISVKRQSRSVASLSRTKLLSKRLKLPALATTNLRMPIAKLDGVRSPNNGGMAANLRSSPTAARLVSENWICYIEQIAADMAELADALDSGSSARKGVEVRLLLSALAVRRGCCCLLDPGRSFP